MLTILKALCILFGVGPVMAGTLALVSFDSWDHRLVGDVNEGIKSVKVFDRRPQQVYPGKNFIVTADYNGTHIFTKDSNNLFSFKVSDGRGDSIQVFDDFVVIRFNNGTFAYGQKEVKGLVGSKISPGTYSLPTNVVALRGLLIHEWGYNGTYASAVHGEGISTSKLHDRRMKQIWNHHDNSRTDLENQQNASDAEKFENLHKENELGEEIFTAQK